MLVLFVFKINLQTLQIKYAVKTYHKIVTDGLHNNSWRLMNTVLFIFNAKFTVIQ